MSVTLAQALTVKCPKCGALPGAPCVYVNRKIDNSLNRSSWPDVPFVAHFEGDPIPGKAHYERNDEFFRQYLEDLPRQQEQVREQAEARLRQRHRITAVRVSMLDWDRRENEKLRDWLRDWGWLLTEANLPHRPAGTLRGRTYLFGD